MIVFYQDYSQNLLQVPPKVWTRTVYLEYNRISLGRIWSWE